MDVFFGGNFTEIGGAAASSVAKWDGSNWNSLGQGIGGLVGSFAIARGQLYVAGSIYSAGGASVRNIACWDGTNWSTAGGGVNDVIFDLASDGMNIYAGGHFTDAGGVSASKVAKWDGTNWSPLGSGIIPVNGVGAVDSLTVHGNDVYVGGRFRSAGGIGATNIARWDGTNWRALDKGLRYLDGPGTENGSVRSLRVHRGFLYAGGGFSKAGSTPALNIARWDGTNWYDIGGAGNWVQALVPNGDDLYAGGAFRSIGGVDANIVAKWDGTNWSAPRQWGASK